MHYTKTKLQQAIDSVNKRYQSGLNDDDQVARMVKIDKETKGFSFWSQWDDYIVVTDINKLLRLSVRHGYWSSEVKEFNDRLLLKGGYEYMSDLNNQAKEQLKKEGTFKKYESA